MASNGDAFTSAPDAPQPGLWRFGRMVLDEQVAALQVDGAGVALDRSSYDVLLALLRHAGEVVTKDELLEAGWPGRVVSENSLAKAVSRLRQALGEDGDAIRVVHGYGYRLAAAVGFTPLAGERVALPHEAGRLHGGDPLPHRPGWRLQRRLGQGSAGIIFLARSEAGEERAIKLATSEAGLRSLKREISLTRYIRAVRDDLPDVARVLDWNLSQPPFFLELPYFADGHLADWANARGGLKTLPLPERLSLCAQLCEAVAALHGIGLIHKDLKPENLYPVADTAGNWRIVLADLGVSEALPSPRLAELGLTLSIAAGHSPQHAGSLLYLAPEVIAGEVPTQRSDVFALGVLIYQLAVGDLRRSLAPGWEADIDDELLREDIALAAAANPLRRDIDAHGLAQRLRSLEQRRVQRDTARRDHARAEQREKELLHERGRRRIWIAAAATAALGLVGMLGMYTYADRARRTAERNSQQRQALVDFVTRDILAQADPYAGTAGKASMSVREAVDAAARKVDARFGSDPAAAAAVHELVGNVYFGQDQHARAIAHYDRAHHLLSRGGDNADLVRVETELCDVRRIAHQLAKAEAACSAAVRHARTAAERDFAALKFAQLRTEQDRYPEAVALLRPLLSSPSLRTDDKALGELYWTLGQCERGLGEYVPAREHFEALLALYRKQGEHSTWTAWAYNSLGSVLVETGEYARAEPLLAKANRIFVLTQGNGVEAQMPNIWRTEARLRSARWAEAKALLTGMQSVWARTLSATHPLRLRGEANLAWAEAMLGDTESARRRLDAALADRATVFDRTDERVAPRAARWLRVTLALGDMQTADMLAPLLERAIAREMPYPNPLQAEAKCLQGQLLLAHSRTADARAELQDCRDELARFVPDTHPLVQEARDWLVRAGGGSTGKAAAP
ncbi:MAG TPA: tetratricopeptide repeat protein [Lysobacter sp.]